MRKKINKPILFSGIQPTGHLTLGHYMGAIRQWFACQSEYDCLFAIVDLHAMTISQSPDVLRDRCYDLVSLYLACDIDPDKSCIFLQSHVPAHCQLAWLLSCLTQIGELNRMTQFKDKSLKSPKNINAGLLTYPLLMASDILLYGTSLVPVGADQKQHLELARNIAQRFNRIYGDILVMPEPYIPERGARIMGLQHPEKKMSKSDDQTGNVIRLLDSPEAIRKKVKRAVTDSDSTVKYDTTSKPGVSNLLTIYSSMSGDSVDTIQHHYLGKGYGTFKADVAEAVVEFLSPIQSRYLEIRNDLVYLEKILAKGADNANARSINMLKRVHKAMGLII